MMHRVGHYYRWSSAEIIGDVTVGEDSSFWPSACARGDVAPIHVGARVSVQDFVMLHCQHNAPLTIEDDVVIGHHATVHCSRIGAGSLIGIHAVVLDGAVVGRGCLIAAGAVVRPGTVIPDGQMVAGVPGKVLRPVSDAERAYQIDVAQRYVTLARDHVAGRFPVHG